MEANSPKADYKRYQFGGSFGGPPEALAEAAPFALIAHAAAAGKTVVLAVLAAGRISGKSVEQAFRIRLKYGKQRQRTISGIKRISTQIAESATLKAGHE